MARLFAYPRVSTTAQAESGLGMEAQVDACERWAQRASRTIDQFFPDAASHSDETLLKRPGMWAMLDACEAGDEILVYRRDRIGRGSMLVGYIEAEFAKRGARFISTGGEGTADDTPESRLMRQIIDAFAEFELAKIRERTKGAMARKKARGEPVGRAPYGWRWVGEKGAMALVPDTAEMQILKRIVAAHLEGQSDRAIARLLHAQGLMARGSVKKGPKPWGHSSVRGVLKRYKLTEPTDA